MTAEPIPDWPAWVARMYPTGIPDALRDESPMSDSQYRYLAFLGVHNRWCSVGEASALINRIIKARKREARTAAKRHVEGTP